MPLQDYRALTLLPWHFFLYSRGPNGLINIKTTHYSIKKLTSKLPGISTCRKCKNSTQYGHDLSTISSFYLLSATGFLKQFFRFKSIGSNKSATRRLKLIFVIRTFKVIIMDKLWVWEYENMVVMDWFRSLILGCMSSIIYTSLCRICLLRYQ